MAEYRPDEATTLSGSARLDAWCLRDGRRTETSLSTGATLRNERQDDRDGIEPSASLELTRRLHEDLEARVSAGTGFRLPTLNELHRPFRVRNDIVEANPQLDPERFVSIEAGLEWKPAENLTIGTALFHHWISDAVANVPVTDPLEIAGIFGTIPPGGSGSIRRNVDAARVAGIEGAIEWLPHEQVTLGLSGLWSDTRFSESKQQPLLEGIITDKQIRSMVIFLREKEKQTMVEGMEFPVPSPDKVTHTELHDYRIETLVESGIERPWAIAFLPDGRKLVTNST